MIGCYLYSSAALSVILSLCYMLVVNPTEVFYLAKYYS